MHRVGRWLDRSRSTANASTRSLGSLEESQNLETALRAVELILNDDIAGAERGLADGNSSFHKLAQGTLAFMKAALGFEQEVMKEASETLSDAESSASASYNKAQHDARVFNSNIYEKGSEFALCQAEAQIMSAVVAVLNESLTESIRGFYKLRKAYMTLEGLVQMEMAFIKARGVTSLANSRAQSTESLHSATSAKSSLSNLGQAEATSNTKPRDPMNPGQPAQPSGLRHTEVVNSADDDSDDDEFHEVDDIHEHNPVTEGYTGHVEVVEESEDMTELDRRIERLNTNHHTDELHAEGLMRPPPQTTLGMLTADADSDIFSNSLDVFIHSGTNLMSGILSLLISIIPPAFSKLLYIIGFRGDRERGIRMLWQASKFSNINGGMASLVLFGWYNGIVGFCDIISDSDPSNPEDVEGYPGARLQALLADMRQRYPQSHLWLVEEARMAASHRKLETALELLSQPGKSQLKQIEALHMFEKSLCAMNAHRYQLCASSFLACVDLNAWSRGLYYYIAGAAHLSLYRYDKSLTKEEAQKHARIAEEYFKTAPTKVGKKKMMGRQLPFDGFVVRKMAKWEERANRFNCSFIDAIGVSPLEEMILLWGGYKKMDEAKLQESLDNLAWSEALPRWEREDVDEQAILAVLKAVILRNLRRHDESKEVLQQHVLLRSPLEFKGQNKDDWVAPTAHHEMAVNIWMQRTGYRATHGSEPTASRGEKTPSVDLAQDAKLVQECKSHLERAKGWEKYELDARLGMKITAALNAVKNWEQMHGNSAR
ncbi:Mitochondrial outer membrane protein iml2 [Exophiala xenobiotica]|nr:Mitochondrial outer membrane protein iml2 [Exophiala xenobiotica]